MFCVLLLVCSLLGGCSHDYGKLAYVSTKQVKLDQHSARKVGADVMGKDVHWFVLLDPTFSMPRMDKAVDDALAKAGGDFMTDAELTYRFFFIPVLYYRVWFEVKGDVWKLDKTGAEGNSIPVL